MEDCTFKSLNTNFTAKHEVISEVHMACYSLETCQSSITMDIHMSGSASNKTCLVFSV